MGTVDQPSPAPVWTPDPDVAARSALAAFTRRVEATYDVRLPAYQDNAPERAFDGSDASFFWAAAAPKKGDWFVVTLDNPTKFHRISVRTGHPTFHRDYLEHGVVDVSPDGHNWTTLGDFHDGVATAAAPETPVKSIRVRVTDSQAGWLAIQEIDAE